MEEIEIRKLAARKKILQESIELAKENKEKTINFVQELVSRYNKGRISRREYEEELYKVLKGKSAEEWVKYYEDYIDYYNYQIKLCDKLLKEESFRKINKKVIPILKISIILAMFFIFVSLFFILKPVSKDLISSIGKKISSSEMNLAKAEKEKTDISEGSVVSTGGRKIKFSEATRQYSAAAGKPVKWKKKIVLEEDSNLLLELPAESKVLSINSLENGIRNNLDSFAKAQEKNKFLGIFGKNKIEVEINALAKEYEIEYETPAPLVSEEISEKNTRAAVKGPEDVHYENILTSAKLPRAIKKQEKSKIRLYQVSENGNLMKKETLFNSYDTDEDGLLDSIEWITPSLSEAVFEIWIIEISNAEHLDGDKNFISDIYEQVKEKDEIWSEKIYNNEYMRVTFQRELDNFKDITFYSRNLENSRTLVEVYKAESDEKIAEFPIVDEEKYYKVYLTEMQGSTDKFDLKIKNLDNNENAYLEFEHIIDPAYAYVFSYVSPTLNDEAIISERSVQVNVTIENAGDLKQIFYDWNKRRYNVYDKQLLLMMNFDNVASLGEISTIIKDASLYGNDGTASGAAWTSNGRYNGAFSFDGINNYVSVPNGPSLNPKSNMTVSMWIKRSTGDDGGGLIEQGGNSWYIYISPAGHYSFARWSGGVWKNAPYTATTPIPIDEWHHVAVIYDAAKGAKEYIDGNLVVDDNAILGDIDPSSLSFIGSRYGTGTGTEFFKGLIDEVRIWNRTFTNEEIYEFYASNLRKYNIGKWNFYINQSKNSTNSLDDGEYTYQIFARDSSSNWNWNEQRRVYVGSAKPPKQISFVEPTLISGDYVSQGGVVINVSINKPNLKEMKFNWNGTNFTLYNESLVLMYNFDNMSNFGENEDSNFSYDASKYGHNGSCMDMKRGCNWTTGKYGAGMGFHTWNSYIQVNDSAVLRNITSTITYSAWIYPFPGAAAVMARYYYNSVSSKNTGSWYMGIASGDLINCAINLSNSPDSLFWAWSSASVEYNKWNFVACVYNGTDFAVYLNNDFMKHAVQPPYATIGVTGYPLSIGAAGNGITIQNAFKGYIDEVRLYNRSLSEAEMKELYFSNLKKYDLKRWGFYINQSKDATNLLNSGVYNYSASVKNITDENITDIKRVFVGVSGKLKLDFKNPTLENNSVVYDGYVPINVSIFSENGLGEVKFNWNGTNFTLYNESLVLMYNFDNVANLGEDLWNVFDVSRHRNKGEVKKGIWNFSGRYGGAWQFNKTGRIDLNDLPISTSAGDYTTVSFWMMWDGRPIVMPFGWEQYALMFYDNSFGFITDNDDVYGIADSGFKDKWAYVTAVFNNGDVTGNKLYINGVSQTLTQRRGTSVPRSVSPNARISGYRVRDGFLFSGLIDEFRIYNRSLSESETAQLYFSNLKRYDIDKWEIFVEQKKNATDKLSSGKYFYSASANSSAGIENFTETRFLKIQNLYIITNCTELQDANKDLLGKYILANDINFNDAGCSQFITGSGFSPIGGSDGMFNGDFDGRGKSIKNLYINLASRDRVGLFSSIAYEGSVKNLKIETANILGDLPNSDAFGVLAGKNNGTIYNCSSSGNISGGRYIGGLVGWNELSGNISECYSGANLQNLYDYGGGLVGLNRGNITDSYAFGNISGRTILGGFVGSNDGYINNSYSKGNVTGTGLGGNGIIGGFIGANSKKISYSYAIGNVRGIGSYVGGFVGGNTGAVVNSYYDGAKTCTGCDNFLGQESKAHMIDVAWLKTVFWRFAPWDSVYDLLDYPPLAWQNIGGKLQIVYVEAIADVYPVPGTKKTVNFIFTAKHTDGYEYLDLLSASAKFSKYQFERQDLSCDFINGNGVYANYSCGVDMQYFDNPGYWDITASIKDNTGARALNDTTKFNYAVLQEWEMLPSPGHISWSDVQYGQTNIQADNVLNVKNLGNVNITNININAIFLRGQIYTGETIPANSFAAGKYDATCTKNILIDNTPVYVGLSANHTQSSETVPAQADLNFCLKQISGVRVQEFKSERDWEIDVVFTLALVVFARKRKKKSRKFLDLEEELEKKGIDSEDLLEILKDKKLLSEIKDKKIKNYKEKIEIPLDIFKQELISPAEVLCKYLREEIYLGFNEIAKLINRDQRTVWINCRNSENKNIEIKIEKKAIFVPLKIFSGRRLSVLESAVKYLKDKGFRNIKIAEVLGKDQRVVATIYSRVKRKMKKFGD